MKYIVIGGSELQINFIETVKLEGFEVHVFDLDEKCPGAKIADFFYNISIKEKDKILKIAKKIKPVAIHTVATEQGNVTACYVSEKLKLFSNSYMTAINTTNKLLMKDICKKFNIPTPNYKKINNLEEIKDNEFKYPIIVKPSDRSAGRGVSLVYNYNQLLEKSREAIHFSYINNILIEEYIDADQYSIETISFNGKHSLVSLCKMTFDGPPNFVERSHHLPVSLGDTMKKKIDIFLNNVLNSFSILCGASHIEIRINDDDEIKLIEIASRMGGWRDWMVKSATGYNYCKAILYSSLKKNYKDNAINLDKISIAKTIINFNDYQIYEQIKRDNPEIFVKDLVKGNKANSNANNLIECDGPYVICLNKDNSEQFINK